MAAATNLVPLTPAQICARLRVADPRFVEIETKWRVPPGALGGLAAWLLARKKVRRQNAASFFDHFLDTPSMDLLRRGACLRLRCGRDGAHVALQYKGPGFRREGALFRSEFSTGRLPGVSPAENRRGLPRFTGAFVRRLLRRRLPPAMAGALRTHLGGPALARVTASPFLCVYQKEKFRVEFGDVHLEPSLDQARCFHMDKKETVSPGRFDEYENEIKADGRSLDAKLRRLPDLLAFDARASETFGLRPEPLDKYRRCASFLPAVR